MSEAPDAEDILDPTEPVEDEAPASAEDRAHAMGWTPKEQFKGDPSRWVDAEAFVKRGEELMPILQANNRRMEKALDAERKERGKLEKTLAALSDHHSRTAAREYDRAMKDIESRRDQAAAAGDVQGVRDATDEIVGLTKEASAPVIDAGEPAELTKWKADNPWFGKDKPMTAAVAAIGDEAFNEGYRDAALVKEVDARVRAKFPNLYKNPNRDLPGAVEGATQRQARSGKTYSDLPADAKAICDDFVKGKVLTREAYVKEFFQ